MNRIKSKFYLVPMIIVFIVVGIIYYEHYGNTTDIIESEYDAKLKLIEQSIYNETKYTDIIGKIAEKDINDKMEENSKAMVEIYKENPDILSWDLNLLKERFNNMDIYIINEDLVIESATIEEEIGMSFDKYPDFSKLLKRRLKGNKFESDTINFSILEGKLKKYSFIPTPDNKYLIELSVNIEDMYPELRSLNIVYLSNELIDKYPFVEDIRVYKFNNSKQYSHELDTERLSPSKFRSSKENRDKYIKKALETNKPQEQIVDYKDGSYRLKYIPYTVYYDNNTLTWWKSYVIEVLYNDEIMIRDIKNQEKRFLRSMLIISVLYFILSIIIIYLIQKNRQIAYNDHLTKLPNRKRFEEVARYKIIEAKRKDTKLSVLFFDLDKFKEINDNFGHDIGDSVLQEVAKRINSKIPKGDIVSRLGGDEFTALISRVDSEDDIIEIVEEILSLFKVNINIDGKEISIKPSIGISIYPEDGEDVEDLILKADNAMYEAKKNKIGYKIYKDIVAETLKSD